MAKKGKKKTFKQLIDEYMDKYEADIDDYRHMSELCKTQKKFDKAYEEAWEYIEDFMKEAETLHIRITLNQKVMKYHMPRSKGGMRGFYTPYIADFHQLVHDATIAFRDEWRLLGLPSSVKCMAYFPIPDNMDIVSKMLSVVGFNKPISTPDTDNIIKFYNDTVKRNIIFDDELIYRSVSEKRYSFKPKVVLDIKALTKHTSKFSTKSFMSRKSVKEAIEMDILNLEFL